MPLPKELLLHFLFWSLVGLMIITNPSSINITTYVDNITLMTYSTSFAAISLPSVSIIKSGTMSTGSSYTLICRTSLIDRFIVLPQIKWTKDTEDSSLVSNSGSSVHINGSDLQLVFDSLSASNAGKYICTVTLRITEIDLTVTSNSSETIFLQSKLCVIEKNEYIISTSFHRIPQVPLLMIFTIAILYHLFFLYST